MRLVDLPPCGLSAARPCSPFTRTARPIRFVAKGGRPQPRSAMAVIKRGLGRSPTEKKLAALGDKLFLNLWTYPNLYRKDGKELCDVSWSAKMTSSTERQGRHLARAQRFRDCVVAQVSRAAVR
jgi:hypothetical protein